MHIMEGFLPAGHALAWSAAALPGVAVGLRSMRRRVAANPELKLTLGAAAAFAFVLTALKLPSVTGSSSHPTGTGLGAVLFGPLAMAPVALVVLLFQALLLAHGGLTTLGANVFALGVVGPLVAFTLFRSGRRLRLPQGVCLFAAVAVADLATYLTTALQLALAFPDPVGGVSAAFAGFAAIFALTQVPLALGEAALSVLLFARLARHHEGDRAASGVPFAPQEGRS